MPSPEQGLIDSPPATHRAHPPAARPSYPPVSADQLRAAFRRQAATVAVVTAAGPHGPAGFTATSVASVSAEPPLLSFNIARTSSSWPVISTAALLGIHLLAAGQEELAGRFARRGQDRFAPPTRWRSGPDGVPVLDGCLAVMVAAPIQTYEAGDHAIVVARILRVTLTERAGPLLHHDGRFHHLDRLPPQGPDRGPGRAG